MICGNYLAGSRGILRKSYLFIPSYFYSIMIDVDGVCSLVSSWLLGSGNGRILEIYTFFEYVIQFTKISSRFIIFMNVSGNPLIKPKRFSSFFISFVKFSYTILLHVILNTQKKNIHEYFCCAGRYF